MSLIIGSSVKITGFRNFWALVDKDENVVFEVQAGMRRFKYEADVVLQKRNILVLPDFLANAGGVTCSYFEQVQSNMNYYWSKDEVLGKLDVRMTSAFLDVHDVSDKENLSMRDAAYVIAFGRVAEACRDRGWI